MLDRIKDRNIWIIYSAIFLLGLAYGIAIALVGLFLDAHRYSKGDIGTLAAWFASGIVAFSLPMGWFIRRFSARNTLAASLAGYACCVAAFPFLPGYAAIAAVRFFDGACSVGVWVSCETVLLARADKENKAYVTSLYAISMAVGYILGPLVARVIAAQLPMSAAFLTSGVLALASAALVATQLDPDPDPHSAHEAHTAAERAPHAGSYRDAAAVSPPVQRTARQLIWRLKTSCFGTFAYGYFQASVVLFLPLYLIEARGVAPARTIVLPAFFAGGMLAFSNFAGKLGDRYGHLRLMRLLATVGTAMILGFAFLPSYALMALAVFIAGATLASISPVSLALQGAIAEPWDYSRANAIYNAFYASGMLLGPLVSSWLYNHRGGDAMLFHLAGLWGSFALTAWVFRRDDPAARRAPQAIVAA